MYDILIRNATVLPMTKDGGALEGYDVAVVGQSIAAIGPTGTLERKAARTIEGQARLLMPGLVNTHTHMGQAFHRGTAEAMLLQEWLDQDAPIINSMTGDDVYWAAKLACCEMLHAGVTVFADMFFHEDRVAQAAIDTGMRAQIGQGIMEQLSGEDLGRGAASEQVARSVATAEEWHGAAAGRITARLAPHAIYTLSPATLDATLAEARSKGYGIHTHLSETIPELEWCQATYGMSPPQWFAEAGFLEVPIIFAHCVHLSDEDIALLDVEGIGVAHNPGSNLKLGSGRARIPDLAACEHLAVGLGSDSTGSNDSLDLLKEAYLAAVVHDWPIGSKPARTCLEMATREGARALGLGDQIGTIEVGKKADLTLFRVDSARMTPLHDPERTLIYAGRGSDVETVIVDGTVVLEGGELTLADEERVLREARERTARLFEW
jgi:5-methylthioadenosine/S-adenosylhomocysteine deaminase